MNRHERRVARRALRKMMERPWAIPTKAGELLGWLAWAKPDCA